MRRRRLLVPLLLALSGLGWAAAHALAHRTVMTDAAALGRSGFESYLRYLPTSLALCLALALPLAAGAALGLRWRRSSGRSLWMFGVVPVLGFAGHALVEPLTAGSATLASTLSGGAMLGPVLLVGLLIQVPFALVVVAFASGILRLAEGVARALAAPACSLSSREPERYAPARPERAPAFRIDRAHGQRGPPSLHLA